MTREITSIAEGVATFTLGAIMVITLLILLFAIPAIIGGLFGMAIVVLYNIFFGLSVNIWIGAVCGSIVALLLEL